MIEWSGVKMKGTWDLFLIVMLYVFSVMGLGQLFRKRYSASFTRRIIHILASDIIIVLPLFSSIKWVILIPATLASILTIAFLFGLPVREAMVPKGDDPLHAYGPVYYIISIGILVGVFGIRSYIPIVATFVMAWGDGFAALVGGRFGRIFLLENKSLEGSLAFLFFSFLGAALGYVAWAHWTSQPVSGFLGIAFLSSLIGTVLELFSIGKLKPFDNFTVPLGVAFALHILH